MREIDINETTTLRNVPFEMVPKVLIDQIRPYANPPGYDQWIRWCPFFDKSPSYWNMALLNEDEEIIGFQYGTWDACGAEMHVIRVTIHPDYFRYSGDIMRKGVKDIRELAKELGMKRVYFITCRWKAFLRKLPGDVEIMDAKVLEVTNV